MNEVKLSQGEKTGAICRSLGVSEQSYYRWRREYGGLKVSQARRLKDLEKDVKELGYEDLSSIFTTATVLGNGMIYNHATVNNVDCRMNFKDFCFCYSANREIKRGEELFINYGQSSRKDLK